MKEYAAPTGRCNYCGKLCFASNKLAKRYLKSHFAGGGGMSTYRCEGSGWYHYGHTPVVVKTGKKQRGKINYERRKKYDRGAGTEFRVPLQAGHADGDQGAGS